MKTTLKLSTLLVALASLFTFSSCLNNDDNSNYATYRSYVTIAGDDTYGYTFYADFGSILKPKTERNWKPDKFTTSLYVLTIPPIFPSRLTKPSCQEK